MLNNETNNCSIPKLEIQELDKSILEKALEHLLSKYISQDTVSKMQEAIAASVLGLSLMPECRTPIPLIWAFGIIVDCWVAAVLVPATFFIGAVRILDRSQR